MSDDVPANAEALKTEGNAAVQRGDHAQAVEKYTAAIALADTVHVYYSNRCAAFINLKRWEEAVADARRTVELAPDWPKGHLRLGASSSPYCIHSSSFITLFSPPPPPPPQRDREGKGVGGEGRLEAHRTCTYSKRRSRCTTPMEHSSTEIMMGVPPPPLPNCLGLHQTQPERNKARGTPEAKMSH